MFRRYVSPFFFFGGARGDTQTGLRLSSRSLLKPDDEGLAVPGALAGEEAELVDADVRELPSRGPCTGGTCPSGASPRLSCLRIEVELLFVTVGRTP